jgi:hypothetical protein
VVALVKCLAGFQFLEKSSNPMCRILASSQATKNIGEALTQRGIRSGAGSGWSA